MMPTISGMARRLCAAALVLGVCLNARAVVADVAADKAAYDITLKCFVANGLASDDRHDAGDDAKADAYRVKARKAFDTAYVAGARIGLADKQISKDLDFAQDSELPKMMRDRSYFLSTAATCKAVGLM